MGGIQAICFKRASCEKPGRQRDRNGLRFASHIVGVSQLVKNEKEAAAIGSVTMIITGLAASFILPLIISYFL
ncbi:hypothetical protein BTO30_11425 [Domibacillus antri]|uniref:Uncharacterized protein n=1 Tax=Domibacillus antri TaxID=1714264 RepID=A0A1Q8Q409_9BACI|nr:hypothetical protein BTO30_11425 [Domibacillus antri]